MRYNSDSTIENLGVRSWDPPCGGAFRVLVERQGYYPLKAFTNTCSKPPQQKINITFSPSWRVILCGLFIYNPKAPPAESLQSNAYPSPPHLIIPSPEPIYVRDCLAGSQNRRGGSAVYGYVLRWGRTPSMSIFMSDPEDIAARNWYDSHLLGALNRWESICFNFYCTLTISPFASPISSVQSMFSTLAIAIPLSLPFRALCEMESNLLCPLDALLLWLAGWLWNNKSIRHRLCFIYFLFPQNFGQKP